MHSHLNYLVANERAADLRRRAEHERLAKDDSTGPATARRGLTFRSLVRLWLRVATSRRLRPRRT
jgi:hypothetical protein